VVAGKQFDVCHITGLRAGSVVDLAVVLQDDALSHLSTRVVAPLVPASEIVDVDRATPLVELDGDRYAVAMHLIMTIPVRSLGTLVGTLARDERALKNAIDTVFFGV
jgi:toxin CcdB